MTEQETWACGECSHTEKAPLTELAGEKFKKTINPMGRRDEQEITVARCPNCGSEDDWQSQPMKDLSKALGQLGRSIERDTDAKPTESYTERRK